MFDKQYFVVYHRTQLICGPLDRTTARNLAEDLDMALMDPGYEAVNAHEYRKIIHGPNVFERFWNKLHHQPNPPNDNLPKAA